ARSAPVMIRFLDMKLRNEISAAGEDPYGEAPFVGRASAGGEQAKVSPGEKPPEGGATNGETANGQEKVEKVMHSAAHSFVVPASAGGEQAQVSPGEKPPEGGTTNGETTNGQEKVEKVVPSAAHSFVGPASAGGGQAKVSPGEKPPKRRNYERGDCE